MCLPSYVLSNIKIKIDVKSLVISSVAIVRLNLINHFVGFIPCQFACNSALRNLAFRWESCKGSV